VPIFPNDVILFNKEAFEVVGQLNERIQKSGIPWNVKLKTFKLLMQFIT